MHPAGCGRGSRLHTRPTSHCHVTCNSITLCQPLKLVPTLAPRPAACHPPAALHYHHPWPPVPRRSPKAKVHAATKNVLLRMRDSIDPSDPTGAEVLARRLDVLYVKPPDAQAVLRWVW